MTLSEKFPLPLLPSYLPRSLPSSFLVAALNAPFNPSYPRALIHSRLPVLKYCFLRHGVRLNLSANRLKPAISISRQTCISQIVFARRSGTFCNLPSFFDSLKMPGLYLTAPTLIPRSPIGRFQRDTKWEIMFVLETSSKLLPFVTILLDPFVQSFIPWL